ncbi:MAG: hexulose-6-phosphate synthase [Methylophaga sp.]|nr:MAG: hexulose-6-phosphate synthase [Methylophaga sp.]
MSKREKLEQRLYALPNDFTWDNLVTVLKGHGYTLHNGKGSRRKFIHESKEMINLHEPHPSGIMKIYVLKQIIEKLGALDSDE